MMNKYGIPDSHDDKGGQRIQVIQPKFQNNFIVEFWFANEEYDAVDNLRSLNFSNNIVSCDTPKVEYSEVPVNFYWTQGSVYGRPRWSTINVSIRDDIRNETLISLGKLIYGQSSTYLPSKITKTDSEDSTPFSDLHGILNSTSFFSMKIRNVSGQYDHGILDMWELGGCFVTNVDYGNLSYENDAEIRTITLTIKFNSAKQSIYNLPISANPELRRQKTSSPDESSDTPEDPKSESFLDTAKSGIKKITGKFSK